MLNPQNTHEKKLGTHEIPTRKNLRPTKYPLKKLGSHKLPTTKNWGPTKYPREKTDDPRTTHEGTMAWWHWTHETYDGTRPAKSSALIYGEVCQKRYEKAEQYKLFWRGINRALQGVGIFLIKKWVVKVMSKQAKWKNDRYWGLDSKDYFFSDICLCLAISLRL